MSPLPPQRMVTARMVGRLFTDPDFRRQAEINAPAPGFRFVSTDRTARPALMVCEAETPTDEMRSRLVQHGTGAFAVIRFGSDLHFVRLNGAEDLNGVETMGELYNLIIADPSRAHLRWRT